MNERQKKFVREYIKTGNATQSAILAGYSKKTAKSIGQRQLTKVDIKQAIEKEQEKLLKKFNYSVEESFENLKKAQELALQRQIYDKESPDITNFLKAEELKGKLFGLYIDKKEVTNIDLSPIEIVLSKNKK